MVSNNIIGCWAGTTWNYDGCRGWLTNKTYADGTGPIYRYTPAGRLACRIWARDTNTLYSYNNAGDLSGTSYSDGNPGTYTCDRRGRRATVLQNGMTDTLAYDDVLRTYLASYFSRNWHRSVLAG